MASVSEDVARRAAQRLSPELDKNLPALVEVQLQGGEPAERFEPLTTAIALAALLVSAAKLAWDVYQDLKAQNPAPAPEQLARRLRLELTVEANVSDAERDKVIAVVVDEVAKVGRGA